MVKTIGKVIDIFIPQQLENESTLDVILVIINFFINKKYFVKMEYTKDYQSNSFKI